jgi:hypothetical protein
LYGVTMDAAFGFHVEREIDISWLKIGNEIWTQHAGHTRHCVDSREALERSLHCPLPLSGIANIKWRICSRSDAPAKA